ncbi:MAG: rRNA pseudouridine synthase, partial [Clostridia bacterium]|nr:rRNA pseudouridine synthase [Clostridia bacterium]
MEEIRLQKYISDCGIMSRRAAEAEILAGRITVNGKKAELGQKINPERDKIQLGGKPLRRNRKSTYTYVMLNKPRGYISSAQDERGRKCVTDLVRDAKVRLYPVGRLDMDSDGLLLMTNDGDLTNKLTHPRH